MSIVGVAIEGDKAIIAGDTRVVNPSKIAKEVQSKYEFVVKIFKITDNIIIGFVGDYKASSIKLIKKIQKELNKHDIKGDYKWSYNHSLVAQMITKIVNKANIDIDLIMIMHDMRNQKRYGFKFLKMLDYMPHKIEHTDFIGLDFEKHEEMRRIYKTSKERNEPVTDEEYANAFIESFKNITHITINEHPISFAMNNTEIKNILNYTGYIKKNGEVDWVANTIDDNGDWVRKVNGKYWGRIISDPDEINRILRNEYNGKPLK